MRVTTIALLCAFAAGISACGEDSQATGDEPVETAEADPTEQASESLASVLEDNSTEEVGFTPGQAQCVADGFIEQFGVEGVQEMGLLTEDLEPGSPSGGFNLSPVEASGAADATLDCVNGRDFVTNLMNSGDESENFDAEITNCIPDALGDNGTRDLIGGMFQGDQQAVQETLTNAAYTCVLG